MNAVWDLGWIAHGGRYDFPARDYFKTLYTLQFNLKVDVTDGAYKPMCKNKGPITVFEKKTLLYDHILRIRPAFNGLSNFY